MEPILICALVGSVVGLLIGVASATTDPHDAFVEVLVLVVIVLIIVAIAVTLCRI